MSPPSTTHLQAAVLSALVSVEAAGHEIRAVLLAEHGIKKSGPGFYQMMARMEDAKLVKGWYENTTVGDQIVRERRYKITAGGRRAARQYFEFATGLNLGFA